MSCIDREEMSVKALVDSTKAQVEALSREHFAVMLKAQDTKRLICEKCQELRDWAEKMCKQIKDAKFIKHARKMLENEIEPYTEMEIDNACKILKKAIDDVNNKSLLSKLKRNKESKYTEIVKAYIFILEYADNKEESANKCCSLEIQNSYSDTKGKILVKIQELKNQLDMLIEV